MHSEITMQWVIGTYEGDQAKSVMAHADHGIGYFLMESGGSRTNPACMVAFQLPATEHLTANMQPVTSPKKLEDLERRHKIRHGIRENVRILATADVPKDFKTIMGLKK